MTRKILLVEDEQKLRRILKLVLSEEGYDVQTAADGQEGIAAWQQWNPNLVITDLKMKPVDGLHVLNYGREHDPGTPCVILTAFGTVEGAVDAMKHGAYDFLTKPVDHSMLLEIIDHAFGQNDKTPPHEHEEIIGQSTSINNLRQEINLLASTDSGVLIQGKSGTGKDLVARALHAASARKSGPFVRVNCASIPRDLLESTLFGHVRGSFTGATDNRKGAFEQAEGGILFLDEIGDLSLDLQPKLLHAVEGKEITPIGSSKSIPVSVKIVSATNQNLEEMIERKLFRMDLFYRLNTMQINIPPLRERRDDIDLLAAYFIKIFCKEFNRPVLTLHTDTSLAIRHYSWPGNVRELRNVIERAVLSCKESQITPAYLPQIFFEKKQEQQAHEHTSLDMVAHEQELLITALQQCKWNQSRAAERLNISRSALRYRLKKYGIKE